ncbi:MAG: hypothetical protein EOM68_21145, partial [Spirochaetia bacterium]|nr:hypothetical protein [Spirochaetia bacterium]
LIRDWLYEALADVFESNEKREGELVQDGDKVDDEGNPIKIRAGEETRRKRNVTFHSFRHYFVTQMRGKLSEGDLRSVVGHQDVKTTDMYTHESDESMKRVFEASSNIIPFPAGWDAHKEGKA